MKGYKKLSDQEKEIFNKFKENFLKVNDSEIEFISVVRKSNYLRVDFKINGNMEWLHVTPCSWY